MTLSKNEFVRYIKQFQFRELFNDMGWNNDRTTQPIIVDNCTFILNAVAEKSGFKILLCSPGTTNVIPDYSVRKKIETKVTKLFQEHLLIFIDEKKQEQIWQLAVRQTGSLTKVTETRYHVLQDPELLYQRTSGLFFTLDEEEKITIVDVTRRVTENFSQNAERITKQFYERFTKEHNAFLNFIKGIDDQINKEWYASLMLNRLMFCYFIQKKGFLDRDKDYLRHKLNECQQIKGNNKFYSFYRNFLLILFHEGLGSPERTASIEKELGKIPFLNGGLFDEHELEKKHNKIEIDDMAFDHIFNFFDQYEWHLDTRNNSTGRDINPDVIGYIFEKYINDRADMGAYYTKEDITEYISKNCIIPFVFDETKRHYPAAFASDSEIWNLLKHSGDTYIYDTLKYGLNNDFEKNIPANILLGLDLNQSDLIVRRKYWNTTVPSEIALPGEIWREVLNRMQRVNNLKNKISSGTITSIADFVTYNLNIRQFTQDVIENTNDPEFLAHFYKAIINITILDPTAGSGAFLFASMNILEPLYEACIMRMRAFVEDEDRKNAKEKQNFDNKYQEFRQILQEIQNPQHPNLQYFIYKSIILRNLYGVDIMKEAVEIAKLRLFLKLAATVEVDYRKPNLGLEPLPDLDFNIRSGNSLIGFTTLSEAEEAINSKIDFDMDTEKLRKNFQIVSEAFGKYKELQLSTKASYVKFKDVKYSLNRHLEKLNEELNISLHKWTNKGSYKNWLAVFQPFNWLAEFYEILHDRGGFDVIIGNPPYVEYSKVRNTYKITNYKTEDCGNLYAFIIERCMNLWQKNGKVGFIVPLSSVSTPRMDSLVKQYLESKSTCWFSFYAGDSNPGTLFNGVKSQLSIQLLSRSSESKIYTTNYVRWFEEARPNLFENLNFVCINGIKLNYIPKIGDDIQASILRKIVTKKNPMPVYFCRASKEVVYYRNASGSYYRLFLTARPKLIVNGSPQVSTTLKEIHLTEDKNIFHSIFSSTLFHWYWTVISDNYHITKKEFANFFFDFRMLSDNNKRRLIDLSNMLMNDLDSNSKYRYEYDYRNNCERKVQIFEPRKSKNIMDQIDIVLAEHYNFTNEELDFIINYDIKYRSGQELDESGE